MKRVLIAILILFVGISLQAQVNVEAGKKENKQANQRANKHTDQAIDKTFDKLEEGIGSLFKKKNKSQQGKVKQDAEDFTDCVDEDGFNVGGTILNHFYSPVLGTATRTSTNNITISGILLKDDLTEHPFTLEATASLVSPVNRE